MAEDFDGDFDDVDDEFEEAFVGSDESVVDDKGKASTAQIIAAFKPAFITTLTDFGDTEYFIIDGDSLLFEVMANGNIFGSKTVQFLHVFYLFERFLEQLVKRKAYFNLIFFANHGAWSSGSYSPVFSVLRAMLIQHMKTTNMPCCRVTDTFPSPQSDSFRHFIFDERPFAVLLSDGFASSNAAADEYIASLLHFSLHSALHVLFFRDIEFSGNRLKGYHISPLSLNVEEVSSGEDEIKLLPINKAFLDGFLPSGSKDIRRALSAWAVAQLLKSSSSDDKVRLAMAYVLHVALLEVTPLPMRSLGSRASDASSSFFHAVFDTISSSSDAMALLRSAQESFAIAFVSPSTKSSLPDFADSNLFDFVYSSGNAVEYSSSSLSAATELWNLVCKATGVTSKLGFAEGDFVKEPASLQVAEASPNSFLGSCMVNIQLGKEYALAEAQPKTKLAFPVDAAAEDAVKTSKSVKRKKDKGAIAPFFILHSVIDKEVRDSESDNSEEEVVKEKEKQKKPKKNQTPAERAMALRLKRKEARREQRNRQKVQIYFCLLI